MSECCHDCGVEPGHLHDPGCDAEYCPFCGEQAIGCDHAGEELDDSWRIPWTGESPLEAAAKMYGFWCVERRGTDRCWFVPAMQGDPGAVLDLNRVQMECRWDVGLRAWVKR